MDSQIKNCQHCHKDFTIDAGDFNYYEKIKVPAPTWCPMCRLARRMSCGNAWSLFYRNCDKCSKRTLSMYPPEKKLTVYCQTCWWADDWDGSEYAMDYDRSRPFLAQLNDLLEKTPHAALESSYSTLKNCDYCNALAYSKDSTLIFWADYCENAFYSSILNGLKWSSDCLRGVDSELCYESVGFTKNYRTFFSNECDNCVDVWFSRNCYGCTNCVGCANLRGASYMIFNVKYSKEDYEAKLSELGLDKWKNLNDFKAQARAFWLNQPYREHSGHSLNLNVSGDHIYNSKNAHECYIVTGTENSKYCQMVTVAPVKDSMDYSGWGHNAELIYECSSVGDGASNVKFSNYCFPDALDTEYSNWCISSKHNFGCANLKHKSYSILNKQYSKDEYEKLREQIIEDMKDNPFVDEQGRAWPYGEFPQPIFSKFPYNSSNAIKFIPKTKEEILNEGYEYNEIENPKHAVTLEAQNVPETILETNENILNEVIGCVLCGKGFKILKGEFDLLKKLNLPIPHVCPKCRESARFADMTKPGNHHRNCIKCDAPIYTPYAEGRPEIVYCVSCYQALFA